jgi:hypothetical protein
MRAWQSRWLAAGVVGAVLAPALAAQEPAAFKAPAPELRGIDGWVNTAPLKLKDLRGRVVVLHFWTFG